MDSDCDGASDYDGDGFDSEAHGGEDCDDADATINPDATEIADDNIDQDCDGQDLQEATEESMDKGCAGCASTTSTSGWLLPLLLLGVIPQRRTR